MGSTPIHSRSGEKLKNTKRHHGLIFILLFIFLMSACQPADVTPSIQNVITSTPDEPIATPTAEIIFSPTPSSQPTIALDYLTLKGLNVTLRHPFYDSEELMAQLVRDFNLSNPWGIHVSPEVSEGYYALAQELAEGKVENDIVIGMGPDLLAAQPAIEWLPLNMFVENLEVGLAEMFPEEFIFSEFSPKPGEAITRLGIPLAYNAGILVFNSGWAEELGFDEPPANLDGLMNISRAALTFNTYDYNYQNNGTGGLWLSRSQLSALSWYTTYAGELGGLETGYEPDADALMESFQFLKEAYLSDLSWVSVEASPYRYFSDRYAVVYEGSLEDLKYQAAYQGFGDFQDKWTVLPYLDSAGEGHLVLEPLSFAIRSSDEKSELASWLFGRWLLEPEQQKRLVDIHGFWPASGDPLVIASDFAANNPVWAAPLETNPHMVIVPEISSWTQIELVFQDAYQRIYSLNSEYYPSILEVFKETLKTNQEQRP